MQVAVQRWKGDPMEKVSYVEIARRKETCELAKARASVVDRVTGECKNSQKLAN